MSPLEQNKLQQEKVKQKIQQLENQKKILQNQKKDWERRNRTHRLIEHGAILETVFPKTTVMSKEEIKEFLSTLSQRISEKE